MQCVALALLVIFALAVLAGLGLEGSQRGTRRSKAYDVLASQYRGMVYRTGWFGHTRVSFQYRSAGVLVGVFPHGINPGDRGPMTQVQVVWPDAQFRCSVAHPPRPARLTAHDGLLECPSGQREFDERYSIRTSDRPLMSNMMSEVVQRLIEQLRRSPRPGPLLVEVQRGVLRVSKATAIYKTPDLLEFVRVTLELYDQTLLSAAEGIEFLDGQIAQPLGQVVCQICGEEIHDDLVYCRRCKTPHHRDCWLYAGRCSVFACGETQFLVPRQATRITTRPPEG